VLTPASTPRPRTTEELLGPELLARLDRLEVLSRKVFAGKLPGERRSRRKGSSVEFDDYRNYVPGDDLRRIDWNVFARMDRFFVKLFREEEDQALHIAIDASASMDAGSPGKLVLAQRLAMALAYIGLVNQSRVIVSVLGAPGRPAFQQLAPMRGRRNAVRVARFILDNVWPPAGAAATDRPAAAAPFNDLLRTLALTRCGKGVLILISDFLVREDLKPGLNYLTGGGFDVHCLQVLSPGEMEPEKEGGGSVIGDLRLTDVETGGAAEVTVTAATIKQYKRRLEAYIESVRSACAARGIGHSLVRSDADLGGLITGYLRRKRLVG
jgi:uncharacterized protein (DUF58 family)